MDRLAGCVASALVALPFLATVVRAQQPGAADGDRPRVRDAGIVIGALPPGPLDAITDVRGVRVGQVTVWSGDSLRTGVTAVLPHAGNLFRDKVHGAMVVGNGFGKLIGLSQVNELGWIETPILLTGTLSVWRAADALVDTMLEIPENRDVVSINPVVGETNDGWLSDIRARPITPEEVREALRRARGGPVEEGSVGAGTGTRALGWKGGIGTASRVVPAGRGGYTVGVLVQTNYGGRLRIVGYPVWRDLGTSPDEVSARPSGARRQAGVAARTAPPAEGPYRDADGGGSVMIVVATDAPLRHLGLTRLARRTFLGIGRTGSWMSNGSGDYAIAFSTRRDSTPPVEDGRDLSALFEAVVEATEEAALNSLFRATTVTGYRGRTTQALPVERVLGILREHGLLRRTGEAGPE
ncbi:MAG: P1 family peptidase [Candidatus Palauibacterales bacterium]|nr:P1 family peptidase [Candidatus Palauibacterales bacterium]MDP2583301.1 P1 family peptidase [Candidatus Palauibacterales bacterium]